MKRYEIEIRLTHYPIPIDLEKIINAAKAHDIPIFYDNPPYAKMTRLWILTEIGLWDHKGVKRSVRHPFDLKGQQEKFRWISCYQFNESIVLRDGKIYTCPMIPYAHYFNDYFKQNLQVKEDCYIDIYKASSFEEIAEFCTHRTSFCDYCAVHRRHSITWKQSKHTIDEWALEAPPPAEKLPAKEVLPIEKSADDKKALPIEKSADDKKALPVEKSADDKKALPVEKPVDDQKVLPVKKTFSLNSDEWNLLLKPADKKI